MRAIERKVFYCPGCGGKNLTYRETKSGTYRIGAKHYAHCREGWSIDCDDCGEELPKPLADEIEDSLFRVQDIEQANSQMMINLATDDMLRLLRWAAERIKLENKEGKPILSAWLTEATKILAPLPEILHRNA